MYQNFRQNLLNMLLIASLSSISMLSAFEILPQGSETEKLGFGEWNISIDGESLLMDHFLNEGDLIFDIGGNHGEWSTFALGAQANIHIMAFEPVPPVYETLKETLQWYDNVELFNFALSDIQGESNFHYYPEADGLSGFYYREVLRGDHPDPLVITVQQDTVDNFCATRGISKIDFIKIDTEGAEWRILNGAKNLLKNHQIRAIQFEYGGCYVDAKTTLEQVLRLFKENHYVVFRIFPKGLIHISEWDPLLENFHLSNYFAIREEDMPDYSLVVFE